MNKTHQEWVKENSLELQKLRAIYAEADNLVKQKYGITLIQLNDLIDEADKIDQMINPEYWIDEDQNPNYDI